MKQLTFLTKFVVLILAISFWSSCGDEGTGGGGGLTLPPVVELQDGIDLVTIATTVQSGEVFNVRIIADKGDNDMTTFVVLEDGVEIDANRLNYNGAGAAVLANPYTLTTSEATTFDTNIAITAHADGGTRIYTFRITDAVGETDNATLEITVPIITTPLALGLDGANGGITSDVTLPNQTNFKVQLNATQGSSPLSTLTVFEDGAVVDASRVKFGVDNDFVAATDLPANPLALIDGEKTGFNWFVWVSSHDSGSRTYSFQVEDEASEIEEVSVVITIFSGTPVAELSGKLLLNAGGPAGTGGMNLLTGDGTGSSDASAHIRDQGIDLALPADQNWKRRIAPVNGSALRLAGTDFPIDDFNAVEFTEEIQLAFNNGTDISETSVINIGDIFMVQAATGEVFLVNVTDISQTVNNNDDFYQLSIKR